MQRKAVGKKLDPHKLMGEMGRTKDVRIRRHSRDSFDRMVEGIYDLKTVPEVRDFEKTWRITTSKQWFASSKQPLIAVKPMKAMEESKGGEEARRLESAGKREAGGMKGQGGWWKDEDLFALSNSTMNSEVIPSRAIPCKPYIREVGRLTYLFPEFKVRGLNDYKAFPLENFESKFDPKVDIGYQLLKVKRGQSRWLHKDGSFSWRPCSLESYNEQTKEILIKWDSNGRCKNVKRMNVIFEGEQKPDFETMRLNANISRCLHLLKLSLSDFLLRQMPFPLCRVFYPCDCIERIIVK